MADKSQKRRVSTKQKKSELFRFWHNMQDIKSEAEQIADRELVLLVGMVELLVEQRIADLGPARNGRLAEADVAHAH
jgi:hypothetical protein